MSGSARNDPDPTAGTYSEPEATASSSSQPDPIQETPQAFTRTADPEFMDWQPGASYSMRELQMLVQNMHQETQYNMKAIQGSLQDSLNMQHKEHKDNLNMQHKEHEELVKQVTLLREAQEHPLKVSNEADSLFLGASPNPVFTTVHVQDKVRNILRYRTPPNCMYSGIPQEFDSWAHAMINENKMIELTELQGQSLPEPLKLQLAARALPAGKSGDWIDESQREDQPKKTFREFLLYFRQLWGQARSNADLLWEWQD
jgi:hypothetical protein